MPKEKPILYLFKLYRNTDYYPSFDGDDEDYSLQIFHELEWIGTYRKHTMQAVLDAVRADKRAKKFEIVGGSYLDYLMPRNALEKAMLDEIIELRRVVSESVGLADLQRIGYDVDTGNALLKRCENHKLEDGNAE
jgi:hypothetical protein